MSKTKSVWESRFYALKHRLLSHKAAFLENIANQAIETKGKELNTIDFWEYVGRKEAVESLIKQAEYIETQTYF